MILYILIWDVWQQRGVPQKHRCGAVPVVHNTLPTLPVSSESVDWNDGKSQECGVAKNTNKSKQFLWAQRDQAAFVTRFRKPSGSAEYVSGCLSGDI